MHADLINITLAFIEGFALIISPCILPILPIILSGSLEGRKSRPLGIIVGFILTFTLVTLFSRILIQLAHVSQDTIRNVAFVILILLGIMMISTYLTEKFNLLTQRLTQFGSSMQTANNPESGFWGGVVFGGLVGIIWTPCAGPILAAVVVQIVIQQTSLGSLLTVIAFAIGACVPMLLIALLGRTILAKFIFLRGKSQILRKVLGCIIIASVVLLIFNPNLFLSYSSPMNNAILSSQELVNGLAEPYQAPDIAGIDDWINSPPLTFSELKGKVVLVDFWTYSCINCIRTLPYLKNWYAKYHDQGFEIIGIHSPEFQFEHDLTNVKNAVLKEGIQYPVALDNQFITWRNFHNLYWPAQYLIDKSGKVVYQHFGEGEDDVTENNIRFLLGLRGKTAAPAIAAQSFYDLSPETYLGFARREHFANAEIVVKNNVGVYNYPSTLAKNEWALQGSWAIESDKIVARSQNAAIKLHFAAGKVYAVMGTSGSPIQVKVRLDPQQKAGGSISTITVNKNQLYLLVNLKQPRQGVVELIATAPGLQLYTFTFGN